MQIKIRTISADVNMDECSNSKIQTHFFSDSNLFCTVFNISQHEMKLNQTPYILNKNHITKCKILKIDTRSLVKDVSKDGEKEMTLIQTRRRVMSDAQRWTGHACIWALPGGPPGLK